MTPPDRRQAPVSIEHAIQVAGIPGRDVARMLCECGVDYLGFPLGLTVHREDVSKAEAARIIRELDPPPHVVLITYLDTAAEVSRLCRYLGVSIVQLHGTISVAELAALRALDPALTVIKSVIIEAGHPPTYESDINEVVDYVDAFITDTFDARTGACGATGKTHDWGISRRIVEFSTRPVILAGGLNPVNVKDAICEVRPAGVDVHTGVEDSRGVKKRELVEAFVSEARDAFDNL
ncbi:MAG: phosphoribosylanthranilate isomerase [Candidatus Krumholzibacteria bacterium]|nr:phosphoribosylanthranilate isomerase [Candidatus Krumholzibacteria bacterium]